jgi:hypothetical protein
MKKHSYRVRFANSRTASPPASRTPPTGKVKKHFQLLIEDGRFEYSRNDQQIAEEAALDGFYVLRTNLAADTLAAADVVRSYKQLAHAEQAFRTLKGPELDGPHSERVGEGRDERRRPGDPHRGHARRVVGSCDCNRTTGG